MTQVLDIHAEIAELRAELAHCILTRKERAEALRRLDELLAGAVRQRCEPPLFCRQRHRRRIASGEDGRARVAAPLRGGTLSPA